MNQVIMLTLHTSQYRSLTHKPLFETYRESRFFGCYYCAAAADCYYRAVVVDCCYYRRRSCLSLLPLASLVSLIAARLIMLLFRFFDCRSFLLYYYRILVVKFIYVTNPPTQPKPPKPARVGLGWVMFLNGLGWVEISQTAIIGLG